MANPANARINGENVTQFDSVNVRKNLYIGGGLINPNAYVTATRTTDLAIGTTPVEIPFESIGAQKNVDVNGTDITFLVSGVYQVTIEFSIEKISSGGINAAFGWIRLNGIDVPNSAFGAALTNQSPYYNGTFISAIGNVSAGDILTVAASASADAVAQLDSASATGGPDIPSVRIALSKIEGVEF